MRVSDKRLVEVICKKFGHTVTERISPAYGKPIMYLHYKFGKYNLKYVDVGTFVADDNASRKACYSRLLGMILSDSKDAYSNWKHENFGVISREEAIMRLVMEGLL